MKTVVIPIGSVHTGSLILVNAHCPMRGAEEQALVPTSAQSGAVMLERKAAVLLDRLMGDIGGWPQICAVSGWRSRREQADIYRRSLAENGPVFTGKYVAKPGHSEHQTGLAVDLALRGPDIDFIRPDFPYTGICRTFRAQAPLYGFIERYPAGKEPVTGIAHEPWHFRYVGAPHAAIMVREGLALEEYHAFLRQFPYGEKYYDYESGGRRIAVSYIGASAAADIAFEVDAAAPYAVSGNNFDGFILTEWRQP